MIPIAIKTNLHFNEDEFREYLLNLCEKHKHQKSALAFAFIVYDFDNDSIIKTLQDKDYWSTLDIISGKYLSVFYINSKDSYYEMRQKEIRNELGISPKRALDHNFSKMSFIPLESTPIDRAIDFIKKEFKIDRNIKTPFVLFFQTNGEDVSDFFIVVLKQEKLEEAFFELRNHIKNAVNALSEIKPEYFNNHQEIFNLIRTNVEGGKFYDFVKKQVSPKIGIGFIISLVKFIAGGK